jgi:hypothetical protein
MVLETEGLSSVIDQVVVPLLVVDVNAVVPSPIQRVEGVVPQMLQLSSVAEGKGVTVMVLVLVTGVPQPDTVNVTVACPENAGSQVTSPVGLMLLETEGLSSVMVQAGVPTIVDENCWVAAPWHRVGVGAAQISHVKGVAETVGVTVMVLVLDCGALHPVTLNVTVTCPVKAAFQVITPVLG